MSGSARMVLRTTIAGVTFNSTIDKEDELEVIFRRSLPAGKTGTLSTRTDDDTGVLTVASGHGITDADTVSVFWDGGYRYGLVVTATTATTISINIGAGTVLPIATTAITVGKEEEHALAVTGDSLTVFAVDCDLRASAHFRDSIDASLLAYDLLTDEGRLWMKDLGFTNPLAGDVVANVILANGGTTATEFRIGMLTSTN